MSDADMATQAEDQVPFSLEQIEWIDQLIAA